MRRLNLFAKGNVDVRDSLLFCRVGGVIQWNGINEVLRRQFPDAVVRIRHETWTRSDALLQAQGVVPEELRQRQRQLPLGPYPAQSQFSRALFTAPRDAVILSIQPDVTSGLYQHRRDGYLLYPEGHSSWPQAEKRWLQDHFQAVGLLEVEAAMANLERICTAIQAGGEVPILVYNLSAVIPGEQVHCYAGLGETLATRIRRFNLALIELSGRLGFSIVDVDTLVARAGADRVRLGTVHLTAEGYRLIAEEVVRILNDWGCFDGPG